MEDTIEKHIFCPICNAGCGLIVEVNGNKAISVSPDKNHLISKGYCCPKGLSIASITNDKDRVLRPLKRVNGKFVKISWSQALREIAAKLTKIRNKSGPDAIAYYMGTNSSHKFHHTLWTNVFMSAVGSKNMYNAGSVDNNNMFVSQYFLYGNAATMPIPDLLNTKLIILIGTNPAMANMSLACCPNAVKVLKDIKKRGGEIYVIDPRRTETAKLLTEKNSEFYVPIVPDTDVFFLLSMINVILKEGLEDIDYIKENIIGFEDMKPPLDFFTPERAETVCKIPATQIYKIARKFAKTKKSCVYGRIGTSLSTFNTLNAWAIDTLNIITGKLDRKGGTMFGKNIVNLSKLLKLVGSGTYDKNRSRIGDYPSVMGAFPLGILAREITEEKDPVRALIVSAGNPILSSPNSNEFKSALDKLDLCVFVDFYINETAYHAADYILPTTTVLEEQNVPLFHLSFMVYPHIEYYDKVLEPDYYGPKEEWRILDSLMRLMKLPFFGSKIFDVLSKTLNKIGKQLSPELLLKFFLLVGQVIEGKFPHLTTGALTFKKLKKKKLIVLGDNDYGVLKNKLQTKGKKIFIINEKLVDLIKECESTLKDYIKKPPMSDFNENEFVLIGRRNLKTMNSWMHNSEFLWKGKFEPKLLINPEDASRINLQQKDIVILENDLGSIKVPIQISDDVIPGVLCYPHGWGHKAPTLSFAAQHPGDNYNFLTNSHRLDPLSGMPKMNGVRVKLKKL